MLAAAFRKPRQVYEVSENTRLSPIGAGDGIFRRSSGCRPKSPVFRTVVFTTGFSTHLTAERQ